MICEKCGTSFTEGRNCPNCGALAVYNKMEDFEKRLVSWDDSMDDADDSMEGNQKKAARAVFE
ncbi:MAG: hypothetical protein K6C69_01490, partial [Lachnospiraceae bacterium]|nr:hypothetical protein [Lachnospiraceae bacterium]